MGWRYFSGSRSISSCRFGVVHGFGPTFCVVTLVHDFGFPAFGGSLPSRLAPGAPRHAEGNAVQPRAEGIWLADRSGLPGQYEEDSLCRVLCFMSIAENVETDAVNDRAMPLDESGESGLG